MRGSLLHRHLVLTALCGWLVTSTAQAENSTPPPTATTDESIIVRGLTQKAMRSEVEKMIYAPWNHQLARWGDKFCPTVVGLPEPYQGVVLDHLQTAAHAAIPDLSASCAKSNVFVVFTDDGTAAFEQILAKAPMLGKTADPVSIDMSDFTPPTDSEIAELRRDRAVRWYRSWTTEPAPGVMAMWSPRFHRFVAVQNVRVSSFEKSTQAQVNSVFVIVDVRRATGATLGQLSDYIAYVVLGGPKLGDSFDPISVMSLFDNDHLSPAAPPAMTRFDTAMLHALYDADPAREAHDEQAEITILVHDSLASQGAQDNSSQAKPSQTAAAH